MSKIVKIAVLGAVALLGLEVAAPQTADAAPMLVQSRMQQMMDRSARRQARLAEDRMFAEEEARMAAEAQAQAARRAQAEAQAAAAEQARANAAAQAQVAAVPAATDPAEEADTSEDEAQTPKPQI